MSEFKTVDVQRIINQLEGRPTAPIEYVFSGNRVKHGRLTRPGGEYPWAESLPPEPENKSDGN